MIRGMQRRVFPRAGEVAFNGTTSWTTPLGVKRLTVFVVGAGGAGIGGYYNHILTQSGNSYDYIYGGAGGGGGYTKTQTFSVDRPTSCSVKIGAGGLGNTDDDIRNGGEESYFQYGSTKIQANGGSTAYQPAYRRRDDQTTWSEHTYPVNCRGGNGGSGGGIGSYYPDSSRASSQSGGSNGGDGGGAEFYDPSSGSHNYYGRILGGKGQGTTTKSFGSSSGTLFSTGGTGTAYNNAGANTGNGGGGGTGADGYYGTLHASGNGGSGKVIVRWNKGGR